MQHTWQADVSSVYTWMPIKTPETESSEGSESGRKNKRDTVREELRAVVREKLGEYNPQNTLCKAFTPCIAASTGKPSIRMHYSADDFLCVIVLREHRLIEGWPAKIPFSDPSDIAGGVKTLKQLLPLWMHNKITFVEASMSALQRARQYPESVLPGTSLFPHRTSSAKRHDTSIHEHIPGQLVLEPACLDVIARPQILASTPPAKHHPTVGQRRDNNSVRERRRPYPRHPKTGVKTSRYVLDSEVAVTGMVVLDDDLGRALEEGVFGLV